MARWLRISKFLLIATLMVSMGGHLALLQTLAWGSMLVKFSNASSLTEAVVKTFDGEHPCSLCKVVEKSKSEEDREPLLKSQMKQEIALPTPVALPPPGSRDVVYQNEIYLGSFVKRSFPVPLRPPRWG